MCLAEAPFAKQDPTLNPAAGACVTCPRRSGFNTSLFADVEGDQCLDAPCFNTKINVYIDREIAARPDLIQIENGYRAPKEQLTGAVRSGTFREVDTTTQNPDAEPVAPCAAAKTAIVVYGKRVGTTLTVCTDNNCPVHDPRAAAREAENPAPIMAAPAPTETQEEARNAKQRMSNNARTTRQSRSRSRKPAASRKSARRRNARPTLASATNSA